MKKSILLLAFLSLKISYLSAGDQSNKKTFETEFFQGVQYKKDVVTENRSLYLQTEPIVLKAPLVIHSIKINLTDPSIHFLVTPGLHSGSRKFMTEKTTEFLKSYHTQLAINGSFFIPFLEKNEPYPVDIKGLSISNGVQYSTPSPSSPVICFASSIYINTSDCPAETSQALSGNAIILKDGSLVEVSTQISPSAKSPAPRTAIALNAEKSTLIILIIDGRQPEISRGVTLKELSAIAFSLGADTALNLDGGGSTTLVIENEKGEPQIINSPINEDIPMKERFVGNHLGLFALRKDHSK